MPACFNLVILQMEEILQLLHPHIVHRLSRQSLRLQLALLQEKLQILRSVCMIKMAMVFRLASCHFHQQSPIHSQIYIYLHYFTISVLLGWLTIPYILHADTLEAHAMNSSWQSRILRHYSQVQYLPLRVPCTSMRLDHSPSHIMLIQTGTFHT